MRRFKNTIIYAVARALIGALGLVPEGKVRPAGRLLGRLAHLLAGPERRLARLQLEDRLDISAPRAALLGRGVFAQLGTSAVELCRLLRDPNSAPPVVIPPASLAALDEALAPGRGVVYATGHIGNWELMAAALARAGYGVSTIAKESYDPRFTALLDSGRSGFGVSCIYRGTPGASAAMLRALGANRLLGILVDQDTDVPGAFVPFLGLDAHTPTGAAALARRTSATLVVGSIRRTASGTHVIEIAPVEPGGSDEETTARISAILGSRVADHPSQWVWFHQRWKTRPVDRRRAGTQRGEAA